MLKIVEHFEWKYYVKVLRLSSYGNDGRYIFSVIKINKMSNLCCEDKGLHNKIEFEVIITILW